MMTKPADQELLSLLGQRPGLKASQIAHILSCKRSEVNSSLYSLLSKKRVDKDDKFCWYLKGESQAIDAREAVSNIKPSAEILPEYTLVLGSFRGNSLFHFERGVGVLEVKLNSSHKFFQSIPMSQHNELMRYIEPLLVSAAMSLERHYYDADLIEEIIDDWGTFLISKL